MLVEHGNVLWEILEIIGVGVPSRKGIDSNYCYPHIKRSFTPREPTEVSETWFTHNFYQQVMNESKAVWSVMGTGVRM